MGVVVGVVVVGVVEVVGVGVGVGVGEECNMRVVGVVKDLFLLLLRQNNHFLVIYGKEERDQKVCDILFRLSAWTL